MGLLGRVHTHASLFDGKRSDCATVYCLTDVMTEQITIILELIKPLVIILSPVLIVFLCGVCKKSFSQSNPSCFPQMGEKCIFDQVLSNEPCMGRFRVSSRHIIVQKGDKRDVLTELFPFPIQCPVCGYRPPRRVSLIPVSDYESVILIIRKRLGISLCKKFSVKQFYI